MEKGAINREKETEGSEEELKLGIFSWLAWHEREREIRIWWVKRERGERKGNKVGFE